MTFTDRKGQTWTFRPLEDRDLHSWITLSQRIVDDGRGVVMDLDEVTSTVEDARKRLAAFLERPDHLALAAVDDEGHLAGTCEVTRFRLRRLAHVGLLALGVDPLWQGRGLGRALTEAAVAWCDQQGIERIELYTRADNERAIALYQSLGFEHEGTRRHFLQLADGSFVDDRIYGRLRPHA